MGLTKKENVIDEEWYYEYVYIEEEEILRNYWVSAAKEKSLKVLVLRSTNDFKKHAKNISKTETKIYLDCDLGPGETRGDMFAKILHNENYKQLYLSTNYPPEMFLNLPWLRHAWKGCPFAEYNGFQ